MDNCIPANYGINLLPKLPNNSEIALPMVFNVAKQRLFGSGNGILKILKNYFTIIVTSLLYS